jgi:carbamoyl-phosphate synthase large subunit
VTRPLNALVLGVGGNVSQSIQKALRKASVPKRIIAACISGSSPGLYVADRAYISPLAQDAQFIPWLLEICEREQIDAVMSGSEIVLDALSPQAEMIREQTGAVSIVSTPEVLATGRDKLLTCRWLESSGLPTPGYADLADEAAVRTLAERCGYPLIAKPRLGKGSDGILTVRNEHELTRVVEAEDLSLRDVAGRRIRASDLILQEYLGDEREEYTAGCLCDLDGNVRGTIVLRRTLRAGTTVTAELGSFPEIRETAESIAFALRPLGPCNVQLRMHQGRAVPFEINPRFSGTTALRARMGFNEVDAALRHFVLGEPLPVMKDIGSGVALRYWNEIYVPAAAVESITESGELDDPLALQPEIEDWGAPR